MDYVFIYSVWRNNNNVLAAAVFAGDIIKTIHPINFVVMMIIMFVAYSFFRGIIPMEHKDIRNGILKVGEISSETIASVIDMVRFFDVARIVALSLGILLSTGNR